MYQLTKTETVIRVSDSASIPNDLGNMDRQAYNRWLSAGNVPLPVPPPTTTELNAPILSQISVIEAKQHRAVRELSLNGNATQSRQQLQGYEDQIVVLRAQLL